MWVPDWSAFVNNFMNGDQKLIKAAFDLFISALTAIGGPLFEKV
jgi:hypothetical protein